jgi:CheY-like chemotaxis protein
MQRNSRKIRGLSKKEVPLRRAQVDLNKQVVDLNRSFLEDRVSREHSDGGKREFRSESSRTAHREGSHPCGTRIACASAMISMKVLIVDDNGLVCLVLGRAISRRNILHYAVEDGKSALAEVRRTFYDLILLDIHLPDVNGLDLLKEIRLISPDTKVVMISTDASESNIQRALAGGALRFMPKPFDICELNALLETVRSEPGCGMLPPNGQAEPIPGRISGSGSEETDT